MQGLKILRAELDAVKRSETKDCKLSAATVFKLQDTFGLPMDLTAAIASGQTVSFDGLVTAYGTTISDCISCLWLRAAAATGMG